VLSLIPSDYGLPPEALAMLIELLDSPILDQIVKAREGEKDGK
jgi:hypothetical protein